METRSLAVKYRPKVLTDLVGQDHIVKQISGMFHGKRMPSSILLHGATGLGKTTIARMLATMVNCRKLDLGTLTPCGQCVSCIQSDHPDIVELNAADTRGIDDIRSLIQQARNMPVVGRKRIFIVDEAHQLTTQAAQTLLKPLEEPPPHTLWIVCTMSPDKLLPALAKRFLPLQVKSVETEVLVKRLYRIAKREGLDFKTVKDGPKILRSVAEFSNGTVRDSIQLLESVLLAFASGEDVDVGSVLSKFSVGSDAELDALAATLVHAILVKDMSGIVKSVPVDSPRSVMLKARWLLDYLINNSVGQSKYTPYSGRVFATLCKKNPVKIDLGRLLQFQYALVDIEARLNTLNVDERVVISSHLANFSLT